jgi:hypothetical protein
VGEDGGGITVYHVLYRSSTSSYIGLIVNFYYICLILTKTGIYQQILKLPSIKFDENSFSSS